MSSWPAILRTLSRLILEICTRQRHTINTFVDEKKIFVRFLIIYDNIFI